MALESESMYRRFGGLALPVRGTSIGETGLASLDPGRDFLLEYFAAAINSELTEVWVAVVGNLPAGHPMKTAPVRPVRDTFPDEPTEVALTQRKSRFPLLAVNRSGRARYERQTLEIARRVQPWMLHYILGPLDVIDQRQLKDICVAVADVVEGAIEMRLHGGYQSGALQFFSDDPNDPFRGRHFSSIRFDGYDGPGQAVFGGDNSSIVYWAIEMQLETHELGSYIVEAEGDLDAADITAGVGGGEGLTPALVIAATDQDPH